MKIKRIKCKLCGFETSAKKQSKKSIKRGEKKEDVALNRLRIHFATHHLDEDMDLCDQLHLIDEKASYLEERCAQLGS